MIWRVSTKILNFKVKLLQLPKLSNFLWLQRPNIFRLNTHKELYKALKNVVDSKDTFETNAIDDHVAKLFLFDFEQCGIHLEEQQRQKVVYLNDTILQLGQRFMTGAVHPRQVSKSVLPDNIKP